MTLAVTAQKVLMEVFVRLSCQKVLIIIAN